jgi:predicted metal-dependent peptidase
MDKLNPKFAEAMDCVLKARSEIIQTRKFYAVLISQVEPVITDCTPAGQKIETAATNGRQHFWNPDFIASLEKNHEGKKVPRQRLVIGTQVHESEHDARHHGTRRNGRDPMEWNIATDLAINCDLIDEGFDLPEGALFDPKYKGWSAEDIYRARELERQQQQQQQQPQPQEEDGDDADQTTDEAETAEGEQETGDASQEAEAGQDETDDGADAGGTSDEGETDGGATPGNGGDEPSDETGGQGSADGEADGETGNGGEADGEGNAAPGEARRGEAGQGMAGQDLAADEETEGESKSSSPSVSSGDPGRCGEVLDSVGPDEGDAADASEDARWQRVVSQAAMASRGDMPGHWEAIIEAEREGTVDWRDELRAFIDQGSRRVETWNRPNRRFVGRINLPGSQKDGINHVIMVRDCSASVDNVALAMVGGEIQNALDNGAIDKITVIDIDTQVNEVREYTEGDNIDLDVKGRGGTYLTPAFDYVEENIPDASLIIVFTDMEFENLGARPEPSCPVLFAAFGYPNKVKEYLANTPWNAPGIDVGAH